MATTQHQGTTAQLTFTPPVGSGLTSPFLLAVPLSPLPDFEVEDIETEFAWRSADRSTKEVVVLESSNADLFAAIRFDDQPDELRKILRLSRQQEITDLQYKPSSGEAGIDVEVEEIMGRVRPDRDRGGFGEFEAAVHLVLARTDLDGLIT